MTPTRWPRRFTACPSTFVVDFLCYNRDQAENIFAIFRDKDKQAHPHQYRPVYSRPPDPPIVTERRSAGKSVLGVCPAENRMRALLSGAVSEQTDFPWTIVRPSQTYGRAYLPVALAGTSACWTYSAYDETRHPHGGARGRQSALDHYAQRGFRGRPLRPVRP